MPVYRLIPTGDLALSGDAPPRMVGIETLDAGGSHDPEDAYRAAVTLLHRSDKPLDLVVGSRFTRGSRYVLSRPESKMDPVPLWRPLGSWLMAGWLSLVTGCRHTDWTSSARSPVRLAQLIGARSSVFFFGASTCSLLRSDLRLFANSFTGELPCLRNA